METLPQFILAGVEKSGSTSLYHYLKQHPDLYLPRVKEPNYFIDKGSINTLTEYKDLFSDGKEYVRGQASVGYFNDPSSADRIVEIIPDIRIFVVLRDPADRAYSHYNMLVDHGTVAPEPYEDVLIRAQNTGVYKYTGVPTSKYSRSVKNYIKVFGSNFNVYFYNDFKSNPIETVQSIYSQLGVNHTYIPDTDRSYNQTKRPKSGLVHKLLKHSNPLRDIVKMLIPGHVRKEATNFLTKANEASVPPLDSDTRKILIEMLYTDIEATERLLECSLSEWKQ